MKKILKITGFGSMAAVIAMMIAATFVEKAQGSPAAFKLVYHNPLFMVLWGLAAVCGLWYLISEGIGKRYFTLILHISFAVILAGALITHLWGTEGQVRLDPGNTVTQWELEDGTRQDLPAPMTLQEFQIVRYPGSKAPSDFRSVITVGSGSDAHTETISMNNIAKMGGFRFYQADYDGDSSILMVVRDPWGVGVTYLGYILLLVGMLGFFFQKESGWRSALRRLSKTGAIALALFASAQGARAAEPADASVKLPKEVTGAFSNLYVYSRDRICPLDGYTGDYSTLKLFPVRLQDGTVNWYSCSDTLPQEVDEDGEQATFIHKSMDLVADYIRDGKWEDAKFLLGKIRDYQVKTAAEYIPSAFKTNAERLYNRITVPKIPFMASLALGLVLFIIMSIGLSKGWRLNEKAVRCLRIVAGLLFAYLTLVMGLRWLVSGHAPFAGTFSVMMLMAWLSALAILLLGKRFHIILPLGFLLSGFTMLMASRSGASLSHLMPVLQSPLLSIHVTSMMMSYTLFGLITLNGIMGLILSRKEAGERLMDLSLAILYPAVFLITFGTFLGAVWANISWGSYWAWDPKETWALITLLVYAGPLHGSSVKAFRNPKFFHAYTIIAFLCVLITYFGVNLILGGMHSYS
ncbi:MAG: cytochrome c biogenesis protein CcsA [Bacteroidales bacterium]|nr:cytochrome c biogenesis protein CcsA [Bacteroidales bacterium]